MTSTGPVAARSEWQWWALVVLPISLLLILAKSASTTSGAADTASYVLSGLLATAVGLGLFAPLFFRRGNRLARTLRAGDHGFLTQIQVTPRLLEALDDFRAATGDQAPFSVGQLARWRMALAVDGDDLVIVDGTGAIEVKLRVAMPRVADVRVTAVGDGSNGTMFPGVVLRYSNSAAERDIELLPVGRGPGGAFSMGRRYCDRLAAWLESESRS